MFVISSPQNSTIKRLKLLSTKKGRKRFSEFIVEGNKFALEIPKGWEVVETVISESFFNANGQKFDNCINPVVVKDNVFNSVSDTVTPSGIISVVKLREFSLEQICKRDNAFIVMACNLQDPGNLGTLIRTADASGAGGVIISKDSADVYSPKVVRSTAGSLFNIPFAVCEIEEAVSLLKEKRIQILATSLNTDKSLYDIDLTGPVAVMIGNESKGLAEEYSNLADTRVKLPMLGKAESLNASVASGIIMYEILRQRL